MLATDDLILFFPTLVSSSFSESRGDEEVREIEGGREEERQRKI